MADRPKNPLKITDLTFRDAHQSLLATRMRTEDMVPIAEAMDKVGFHSVEVWGGATFDVMHRFLGEDPWERPRVLKRMMPNTPFQMLLRGQNLVGYRNYPDDVVEAFVEKAAEVGIDIFRVFDAVNDERNFETAFKVIRRCGKHIQGSICYSLTERKMGGPVYNLQYFVDRARILEDMGIDSLCIKDMAGLIAPYDAYELVKTLKENIRVPIQLHTHFTSGMADMTYLKAIEAGVDIVDTALAPLAMRTAAPAVEPLVVTLQGTGRDTGLEIDQLLRLDEYVESIVPKYRDFLNTTRAAVIDTQVLKHQVPGGMISNLVNQLREQKALHRIDEVYAELPKTRADLGYPPLVTPTSQIVGVQAVINVLAGRYKMVSNQTRDYVLGLYGKPPVPITEDVEREILKKGEKPITCRPADTIEPELEKAKKELGDLAKDIFDVLIFALYPYTAKQFLRWKYGLDPIPETMKPKSMEDIQKEDQAMSQVKKDIEKQRFEGK